MSGRTWRVIGSLVGMAALVVAGGQLGGWWWVPAVVGAPAAVAVASARRAASIQAAATLVLVAGAASLDRPGVVGLVVVALFVSLESQAVGARVTVVTPRVRPGRRELVTVAVAAAWAGAGMVVAGTSPVSGVATTLAAIVALGGAVAVTLAPGRRSRARPTDAAAGPAVAQSEGASSAASS